MFKVYRALKPKHFIEPMTGIVAYIVQDTLKEINNLNVVVIELR